MTVTKTDLERGFFVIGGTVQRDAPCYVVRQADRELYEGLKQGQFCYVLTSRQMGKSSLMVRTAALLREEGLGVAVLDLTAIGQNLNPEQWYGGLLTQMGQQLDLEDDLDEFWESHHKLSPLQRCMQAIRQVVVPRYVGRVVIFVDEIDAVRSLPFSTDEFFAGIREFYNRRTEDEELKKLTFCLLGVAAPSDLIRDTRTTPFNIGQRIELTDFTEAEATPLAQGLMRRGREGAALLKRVLYWTGGHPYLTQRLCQAVADYDGVNGTDSVDRLCEELFLARRAKERDDNLLFVRERLLRSEMDVAGLLSLYSQIHRNKRVGDDETNPLGSVLRLSGITRVEDGRLRVRNRIYERVFDREWVATNLPDAELKRQRAAYRRGLLRAGALAAVVLAVVSGLAFTAVKQRNLAKEEARRADQNAQGLQTALAEAQEQRTEANHQRQEAVAQKKLAEEKQAEAEQQSQEAINQKITADKERDRAQQQERANRRVLYAAQMNLAQQNWEASNIGPMNERLSSQAPQPRQEDLRGFEWYLLWRLGHRDLLTLQHEREVASVAFSPDGKWLAAADGRNVILWDATMSHQHATLKGHTHVVNSVAFAPDSRKLATGSYDHTVRLWDVTTGQEVTTLKVYTGEIVSGMAAGVSSVTFSPDGTRLAAGVTPDIVKVLDVTTGQELAVLKGDIVRSIAYSPDGKKLAASGNREGSVKLWDTTTGRELATLKGHTNQCSSVAFSPNGKILATGGDRTGRLWDVSTGQELATLRGHTDAVNTVRFSPDGTKLATGSADRTVKVWDVTKGQELTALRGHTDGIRSLAFSPDGRRLATGSTDRTVKLWEVGADSDPTILRKHTNTLTGVVFSPDGKSLATASTDKTARICDSFTGQELAVFQHSDSVFSVAFSPDGKMLATAGWHDMRNPDRSENWVKLWDVAKQRELTTLKSRPRPGLAMSFPVSNLAFSPDGKSLATGNVDGSVDLWNVATGQEIAVLKGHTRRVTYLVFSPDGRMLATRGSEGDVKLWDVATSHELTTLKRPPDGIYSIAFARDGKGLATGNVDGTVTLWDIKSGQELRTLKGHARQVMSLSYSPDGKRLASKGEQNVKLWDLTTGQELMTLNHGAMVWFVTFSPDGKTLAVGTQTAVFLWRAATEQEILARREKHGSV